MPDTLQQLLEYQVTMTLSAAEVSDPVMESSLATLLIGVQKLGTVMGGSAGFGQRLHGVAVTIKPMKYEGMADAHKVALRKDHFDTWTVVHELAHAWDAANDWKHSAAMQKAMGAGYHDLWCRIMHIFKPQDPRNWYLPGNSPPPCGIDQNFNAREDFAEAVAALVFPAVAKQRAINRSWPYTDPARGYAYSEFVNTPRGQSIQQLLAEG